MNSTEEETRGSHGHLKPPETGTSTSTGTGSGNTGITIPKSASTPTAPPLLASASSVSASRPPFPGNSGPSDREEYDRVFPIRSVVKIEPQAAQPFGPESPGARSSTSMSGSSTGRLSTMSPISRMAGTPAHEEAESVFRMGSRSRSVSSTTPNPSSAAPSAATRSASVSYFRAEAPGSQVGSTNLGSEGGFYTERHKHVITDDGHMIVTGVAGAEKMQRCEDEAIHIPGAVQGFGCLVAVREQEDGAVLDVRVVSENSKCIIGYSPSELFARGNFLSILSDEQAESLTDHIDFIRDDADARFDGPEVFSINVTGPDAVQIKLWCAIHLSAGDKSLFICEFELEDDNRFPLNPTSDSAEPAATLGSKPTHEELLESTMSSSRPLRVLRSARKRRGECCGHGGLSLVSQIQEQLASATDLGTFLKIAVGLVKELTGFHRVMVYQFDEAWNGRVVTELVDPKATEDLYRGLHFPASDIPAQARALYAINKVRLLYDREQTTARLVCNTREDLETPLDLTHSYLRAMSPIHLKYLGHMGVRASMSISLTAFDQLWGLVSCHSYSPMRVSFPIRKMCRLIGETASRNIERLSYARRLHARKLVNTVPTEQNPGGYIVASSDDLLKLFDADCGVLSIRDETKLLGKSGENSQEALAMLEYLRIRNFTAITTSQDIVRDFPDLKYKPGFNVIAGLLLVPLSSEGRDFIVFFRQPQVSHVQWAGNPYDKKMKEGTNAYLEPRTSFKKWSETVVGRSREWTEEQVETAAVLCLVYGKFIEVWRQKEAALKNSQLTRLLLANASHEVRTPLNAIINYLEIALEGPLDRETRDNLARSHSASKSLIYVINDLLALTRIEEGQDLVKDEIFDLRQVIFEATDQFRVDTDRKKLSFEVVEYPGLPSHVKGDPARVRQVISNVTANAVKHTSAGGLKIEVWAGSIQEGKCDIEIAVEDTGEGISPAKLNTLFGEFEQIHMEEGDILSGSHKENASSNALSKIPGQKVLGLGLAVVVRAIKNMNGQLRLKSEEGKGSRFTLRVPFTLPSEDSPGHVAVKQWVRTSLPMQGEVTLIQPPVKAPSPQNSSELGGHTRGSSSIEIDRLVDAISSPPTVGSPSSATEYFTANPSSAAEGSQSLATAKSSKSSYKFPVFDRLLADKSSPGNEVIGSSVAPVRPVRLPYEEATVLSGAVVPLPVQTRAEGAVKFTLLVAEDDPINSKIIKKRLERMGHKVVMTANGEECFDTFSKACGDYDAILMDLQMPIMNGSESTNRIRCFESDSKHPMPLQHATHGRIPIFAVSASLFEERWLEYSEIGFDGWILKPIDFGRLAKLLEGTRDTQLRREAEYVPGQWERGGWFLGAAISLITAAKE